MYEIETLNDLIEKLQDIASEEVDGKDVGSLPVRIAYQQSWPLAGLISEVTVCRHEGKMRVWLAEYPVGSYENPYAPRDAWEGGIEGVDFTSDEEDWCEEDEDGEEY